MVGFGITMAVIRRKHDNATEVVFLRKKTKQTLRNAMRRFETFDKTLARILSDRERLIKFKNNIIRANRRKGKHKKD